MTLHVKAKVSITDVANGLGSGQGFRLMRACGVTGQCIATQRGVSRLRDDEETLRTTMVTLTARYGRCGYRRITGLYAKGWLTGKSQAGGAHLASGGAEGTSKTAQRRSTMA